MSSKYLFLLAFCVASCAGPREGQRVPESSVQRRDNVVVAPLPEGINTAGDDFAIVQGPTGRFAHLTSNRPGEGGRQDIFRSSLPLREFRATSTAGVFYGLSEINTSENEGTTTFTPDGLTMIFAAGERDDGIGSSDLYQADFVGGRWTNIRNLTPLNSTAWESHPSLSADGKTLYFISDRDGGLGEQDIYVSSRLGDNWTAPQNLGPTVNTPYHEASPFIAADGRTLYFSSLGHPGLGGYDIYVTKNSGGVWSAPENAGTPINSTANDLFYSAELGTQHAFLASDRSGGLGGLDIFSVEPNPFASEGVTVVHGYVRDRQTKAPLGASVDVTSLKTNEVIARFRSDDSTGEYLIVLQPGESYVITAEREGYLFYSDVYEVSKRNDVALQHDILLSPTLAGSTRLLVFFDFNSAELKRESFPDLNRAALVLKNNPAMRITVAGYTDSIGSDQVNQSLSEARAKSVRDYIVKQGVAQDRIQAVGYGKANPIATNETEEGRAQNRRVEFQVR